MFELLVKCPVNTMKRFTAGVRETLRLGSNMSLYVVFVQKVSTF